MRDHDRYRPTHALAVRFANAARSNAARSRHSGGVNAALADGSIRFFSNDLTLTNWQHLGDMDGGERATLD